MKTASTLAGLEPKNYRSIAYQNCLDNSLQELLVQRRRANGRLLSEQSLTDD
jgi:hypothetical protein